MVEFKLEEGISDTEAVRLIETPPNHKVEDTNRDVTDTHQTLRLDITDEIEEDPFTAKLIHFEVIILI